MARLRERLGRTIRALRERRIGLSQESFANGIGLDEKFMGEDERAEKSCGIETLELIAGGLRMPLWEIVRAAEAAPEQPLDHDSNASEAAGRRRQPIPPGYPRGHGRKPLAPNDAKAITREPALGPAPASPGVPRFLVIVQQTQAGYSAHVPDLPGCFTSAASGGEVENAVRTAIAAHLQQLRITEEEPPGSRSYAMVVEIPVSPS